APYMVRRVLAAWLGIDANQVRVIAPQVGGGFGPKAVIYPEELAIAMAARRLERPLKWVEDRREHFLATTQQRDQIWTVEVAADRAEVRWASFVGADDFPYRTGMKARDGSPIAYDSGNFHACLDAALRRIGSDFRERQARALSEGRYIGLGIASYVEDTGL